MWLIVGLVTVIYAFLTRYKKYKWIYIISKTYRRDIRAAIGFARFSILLWLWGLQKKTVPTIFSSLVKKHPHKVAFYFEDHAWTYEQVDEFSNKIARYFKSQGYKKGDCIALLLENRPEFPSIWLGLSKIGVVTALVNTNLVNDPLLHSVQIANCKAIIYGSNHLEPIKYVLLKLSSLKSYQLHEEIGAVKDVLPDTTDLRKELEGVSDAQLEEKTEMNVKDPLVYIYTSGTTGLPKAAVISNIRFMFMAMGVNCLSYFRSTDIIYNPLPLYHTAGCMLGIGQTFLSGNTVAIRKKFSASNYWLDCAKYNCTMAQYVGEICRYVLAAPYEPIKHSVRAVFGNGLRPQIWRQFVDKFNIQNVFEVYGATEGISNLINTDNTVGCVGFVPRYCRWVYPITLIKCNEITGEPIKDENGFCIECGVNEPGLVIGKINPKRDAYNFNGYVDKVATKKKVLQNVFRNGDMFFNSGDILVYDDFGSFFFKDRTGDTFRWKGENVSTTEVEGVISNIVQLNDAVVFGVEIPETEGKAGMAAIVSSTKLLDLDALFNGLKKNLPSYAVPVFIRVMASVPMTSTFKLKKIELQVDGYDVNKIQDDLYFYNSKLAKYSPLTKEVYEQIIGGQHKF